MVLMISLMAMLLAVSLSLNLVSKTLTGVMAAGSAIFAVLLAAGFVYWVVRRLEDSESRLGVIVESAADGILTTDEEGVIESVNSSTLAMFGFRSGELLGNRISVLLPSAYGDGGESEGFLGFLRRNGIGADGRANEALGLRRDGTSFQMELSVSQAQFGDRQMFTVIVRDVTERHAAQEALRAAHRELEGRVQARTQDLQHVNDRLQQEIEERVATEREREKLILELQEALAEVKTLSGLLPICASCKKIRDDTGYWSQIEVYIGAHSDAEFSHGLCPGCMESLYPELGKNAQGPEAG